MITLNGVDALTESGGTVTVAAGTNLVMGNNSVPTAAIQDDAVTQAKVGAGAIDTTELAADAVDGTKLADNAVNSEHYTDGSIDTEHVADGAITAAKVAADVATQAELDALTTKDADEIPHIITEVLYPAYKGLKMGESAVAGPIDDISDSNHTIGTTVGYNARSDEPKVGFGYLKSNTTTGSGGSYITIGAASASDFEFGTGAFTIEYWVKETDFDWGDHGHFTTSQGNIGWAIQCSGTYIYFTAQGDVFGSAPTSGNKIIARANRSGHCHNNYWYHVAIVRVSTSDLKIYINGVNRTAEADAGGTYGWGWNNTSNDTALVLGRSYPASNEKHTVGAFDSIRITKGLAVYTGTFNPPTQILTKTWSAGTNIAANSTAGNVKLLMTTEASTTAAKLHSGAYGTAQADGRKYYYTDIAGSKPLTDPRIGAHYGNQRYLLYSKQQQVQESGTQCPESNSTQPSAVFRFEGREWVRGSGQFDYQTDENGIQYQMSTPETFIEITGYFSDANIQAFQYSSGRHFQWSLDGGPATTDTSFRTTNNIGPASGRFLNFMAWRKLGLGATLGIHTLKITNTDLTGGGNSEMRIPAFELTAQDTSSTANKSKIQIPSQNVVAYGKKHTIAATPHYNPFAFAGDGTTAVAIGNTTNHGKVATGWAGSTSGHFDSTLDVATSLGLDAWVTGGNYYRPVNGGRIVKWIDASGNIKTSVNMMPPTARGNFSGSNDYGPDAALPTSHSWTTLAKPKFSAPSLLSFSDHAQAEVAKEYLLHEFGNGSSNQGVGGSGKAADFSKLNSTNDNCAYTMDDGLTGMSCKAAHKNDRGGDAKAGSIRLQNNASGEMYIIYFIGTGWSWSGNMYGATDKQHRTHLVQNLPYGTHSVKFERLGSSNVLGIWVDGVKIKQTVSGENDELGGLYSMSIYQPKMPPIPKEACIIADYMLLADFVPQDTAGQPHLPKGSRYVTASRDHYYNGGGMGACTTAPDTLNYRFIHHDITSNAANETSVPGFGTRFAISGYGINLDSPQMQINDSNVTGVWGNGNAGGASGTSPVTTVGNNKFEFSGTHSSGNINYDGMFIASPIHTSSHYQEYETLYSYELLGGDRNIEQTNIKVTGDGKTWDDITRDVNYLGPSAGFSVSRDGGDISGSNIWQFDLHRGMQGNNRWKQPYFNKGWAIAWDRMVCLIDGHYCFKFYGESHSNGGQLQLSLYKNDYTVFAKETQAAGSARTALHFEFNIYFERGDTAKINVNQGTLNSDDDSQSHWTVTKLDSPRGN